MYMYIYVYICMCVCVCPIYIYVYICVCMCVFHIFIYIYMCVCVCVYVYVYTARRVDTIHVTPVSLKRAITVFRDLFVCIILHTYNSHHKSRVQGGRIPPAPQAPASGQKTNCCFEREDPAAAGIRRFFSLSNESK